VGIGKELLIRKLGRRIKRGNYLNNVVYSRG
jgi:hypothetical protein